MKLFYDHIIDRSKLSSLIEAHAKTEKEKKELHGTLDELFHNAVLDVILVHLSEKHHEEFLEILHKAPHSQEVLIYIKQKGHPKIEEKIKERIEEVTREILKELGTK